MYTIKQTAEFSKNAKKLLSTEQQKQLTRIQHRLRSQLVGDALGPSWLREVKIQRKRAYFLVDEPLVVFIAVSKKQDQQETIDAIQEYLDEFKELLHTMNDYTS